ncbi:tRNA pseudouridine(54/55) synthase Pus10 [Euryarchaeota archaeon ex4484_178]|nr:MAG: tRNA pseudouridine(54/55) synthase Pus10 [Euryarchaeota archaeon ex4484_178]
MKLDIAKLKLCDHCLGRLYGLRGHGLGNEERGRAIRIVYAMENNIDIEELYPEKCELCGGIFERLDDYARYVVEKIKEYEFNTFLIGSKFSEEILKKEKELQQIVGEEGESIGREFNREIGKRVMELTGKEPDLKDPDIAIIIDTRYDDIKLEIKPLLIYGRYRKLVRGIPQTKWPSGKYKESVEEIIAKPVMEISGGAEHALHGMGREDIDARMLGNGRPFILEIKRPRRRNIDLKEVERMVNLSGKVEIFDLRFAHKDEIVKLKEAEPRKRYRIAINVDADEDEIRDALKELIGKIKQRTPTRVKHRRADKTRIREVYDAKLVEKKNDMAVIEILAQSGTYIKELMHGDNGRTQPNLAEKLGKKVEVKWLDVIEILDSEKLN